MHTPSRQDAQGHLQRLVRRRGVAAAAGAAGAAARPAAGSPRCSPAPVNSLHVLLYRYRYFGAMSLCMMRLHTKPNTRNVTNEFGKSLVISKQ